MAKNLIPFKLNRKKLIERYAEIVYKDDAYESTLIFNRIMEEMNASNGSSGKISLEGKTIKEQLSECLNQYNNSENTAIILRQVTVYGRLNAHGMEIDNLLKVMTDENFYGVDSVALLNRLVTFFGFLMGVDVYDYYLEFLRNRFPSDERLKIVQKPLEEKISKGLHFVDDGDRAFNIALSKMATGDYNGAMHEIDEKSKLTEKDFRIKNLEAAMLLSMGAEKPATQILNELEVAGCRDAEFYANLYQLSKINRDYVAKAVNMLKVEPKLSESYELLVILASLYAMKDEYIKAVSLLKQVKGIRKDGREVLKLLAECYYVLNEKEKLVGVLRRIVTLYPNDIWARFYLLDDNFDLVSNINRFQPEARKQLKTYLKNKTKSEDAFNKMDRAEAFFLFKALEEIKEPLLSKQTILKIYNSRHRNILFDALISVHTDSVTLQLIFQILIENRFSEEFYALKDCELKKYKLNLPPPLIEAGEDKEKYKFLLTCYAQTYALVFYLGFDVNGVEEKLTKPLEWLVKNNLLEDKYLYRDECVVYLLSNALFFNNEYIERTFTNLKKTEKQQILAVLENIEKS